MTPGDTARAAVDPVVEAYKRDVDRTLLDRNLRLHPPIVEQAGRARALQRVAVTPGAVLREGLRRR